MTRGDLEVLTRAHRLFAGSVRPAALTPGATPADDPAAGQAGLSYERYRRALHRSRAALRAAADTDVAAAGVIARAQRDHGDAHTTTAMVVDEARADAAGTPDTPLGQREALRRRVARLHAQRAHVLSAQRRARRHAAMLRGLRYRAARRRGVRVPSATGRAGLAVRAALSRLGRPYVWGATGPDQFDCSGLTQWSYAQAGIRLDRTTYQQIHDGVPVPRSQVRPGDLVFPHAGHVQLAIGDNLVVEAPHAGAAVRISPLGSHVQIRRPLP
ncbi:C40 family peptidase [Mycobacterium sp.]|uniref:C40 family peptidase n=1 Tax=Mycobacterium sp. TaxID=1785 RepID=UPI0031DC2A77